MPGSVPGSSSLGFSLLGVVKLSSSNPSMLMSSDDSSSSGLKSLPESVSLSASLETSAAEPKTSSSGETVLPMPISGALRKLSS